MKKLLITILVSLVVSQLIFADSEQTASRYVEYWNMGEERAARNAEMFTGLAIAQLVAQDKVAYDDMVGKYLPDYPDEQVRDEVTVHQLLTHTSGFGSYWTDAYTQAKNYLRRVSDFAQLCSAGPLALEPGSNFEYSNCGPVVLGLIIEAVSGQNYYDYIRAHVYAPAGMQHSDHYNKVETDSGNNPG